MTKFAATLERLKEADAPLCDYAAAREAGYYPVRRVLECDDGKLEATLFLVNNEKEQRTLNSDTDEFIALCLAHWWGFNAPLSHIDELDQDQSVPSATGSFTIDVECGLFRAGSEEVANYVIDDQPAVRHYQLLIPILDARHLCPIPADPRLKICFKRGGSTVFTFPAYIDQLVPASKDGDDQQYVAITGRDVLTGTRAVITAGYNLTSNAGESLVKLGVFLDVPELKPGAQRPEELGPVDAAINESDPEKRESSLREAFKEAGEKLGEDVKSLAEFFAAVLNDKEADPRQLGGSFVNSAWALAEGLHVCFAVGHVQGIQTEGAVRIAPNVFVCTQDSTPVRRTEVDDDDAPLCATWPNDGALLIAFYVGGSAPETTKWGGDALRTKFTLLSNVLCDTGWLETTDSGEPIAFWVDGKLQDAVLTLSPHYHVQELYSGMGHQAYIGSQKSSHELELHDFAVTAIRQRADLLSAFLPRLESNNRHLADHVHRAMDWLAKSRRAASPVEQFVCIWIALEYLLVKDESRVIKDSVANGITAVMGRGDGFAKSWWERQAKSAYDLRCDIVHRADEDADKIRRYTPLMRQAAFEVIWHCAKSQDTSSISHPSELIDRLRFEERDGGSSEPANE